MQELVVHKRQMQGQREQKQACWGSQRLARVPLWVLAARLALGRG